MPLDPAKFILPVGDIQSSRQPTMSSDLGPSDILRRAIVGWADYTHGAASPVGMTAAVWTNMANNANGGSPSIDRSFLPTGVSTSIWNASTNQFQFGTLSVGDLVNIRLSLAVAVPDESLIQIRFEVEGGGGFTIHVSTMYFNFPGTYTVGAFTGIPITQIMRTNPMRVQIRGSGALSSGYSHTVGTWHVQVIRRGLV